MPLKKIIQVAENFLKNSVNPDIDKHRYEKKIQINKKGGNRNEQILTLRT